MYNQTRANCRNYCCGLTKSEIINLVKTEIELEHTGWKDRTKYYLEFLDELENG